MAQARQWLAQGMSNQAVPALHQALRINPTNVEACEIMAGLAETSGSPATLQWRKRVAELAPDLTNQLKLASCAMRFESSPFPLAQQVLKNIEGAGQSNVTYHTVASILATRLNRLAEAERHLEHAMRLDPTNALHEVNLSVLQLQSQDARVAEQARERLQKHRSTPVLGLIALRSLVADGRVRQEWERAERFADELVSAPGSAFPDRLTLLAVLRENRSSRYPQVLQTAREQAATNAVTAAQFCGWLTEAGDEAEAIAWAESLPASIREQRPVQVAVARCYLRQKDWKRLENFVRGQQWGDLDFMRLAWLSRALEGQGDRTGRRLFWNRAVRLVTENAALSSLLAQTANEWGWNSETEELLWSVLNNRPVDSWVASELVRQYQAAGNTRGLLKVYTTLFSRNPSNPILKNNLAMSRMLLRTNLAAAHEHSRENYQSDPQSADFAATYAFSLFLQQQPAAALEVMRSLSRDTLEKPSTAAYYGIILASAGEREQAGQYLALARQAALLPEEKELVDAAMVAADR